MSLESAVWVKTSNYCKLHETAVTHEHDVPFFTFKWFVELQFCY